MGIRLYGPQQPANSNSNLFLFSASAANTFQTNNPSAAVIQEYTYQAIRRDLAFKFEFIGLEGTE